MSPVPVTVLSLPRPRSESVAPIPKPSFSWADIEALRPQAPHVPAEAFTLGAYCEQFGMKQTTAREELKRMVDAGVLATAQTTRDGHLVRVYWRAR